MRCKNVLPIVLLLWAAWLPGQANNASPAPGGTPDSPSVTFSLEWPAQDPPQYTILVTSSGAARYHHPIKDSSESFTLEWTLSEELRTQIFSLAKQANYFQGEFESKAKVAKTGTKVLAFKDSSRNSSATYNYSDDKAVRELTRIFQAIATTANFGEKLERGARFDHLGLNVQLKALQDEQRRGGALEIGAIQQVLRGIAGNRTFMNVAQQRAAQILKAAGLAAEPVTPQGGE